MSACCCTSTYPSKLSYTFIHRELNSAAELLFTHGTYMLYLFILNVHSLIFAKIFHVSFNPFTAHYIR